MDSYEKKLNNTDTKKINRNVFVDTVLDMIVKKKLKKNFIRYGFRNNSKKQRNKICYESN